MSHPGSSTRPFQFLSSNHSWGELGLLRFHSARADRCLLLETVPEDACRVFHHADVGSDIGFLILHQGDSPIFPGHTEESSQVAESSKPPVSLVGVKAVRSNYNAITNQQRRYGNRSEHPSAYHGRHISKDRSRSTRPGRPVRKRTSLPGVPFPTHVRGKTRRAPRDCHMGKKEYACRRELGPCSLPHELPS